MSTSPDDFTVNLRKRVVSIGAHQQFEMDGQIVMAV